MTPKKQDTPSREEFDALMAIAVQAAKDAKEAREQQIEVGAMIRDLHAKLLEPQPGHDRSLLDRIAAVTISVESGDRVARMLVRGAQIMAAVGALMGTAWIASKSGAAPK